MFVHVTLRQCYMCGLVAVDSIRPCLTLRHPMVGNRCTPSESNTTLCIID